MTCELHIFFFNPSGSDPSRVSVGNVLCFTSGRIYNGRPVERTKQDQKCESCSLTIFDFLDFASPVSRRLCLRSSRSTNTVFLFLVPVGFIKGRRDKIYRRSSPLFLLLSSDYLYFNKLCTYNRFNMSPVQFRMDDKKFILNTSNFFLIFLLIPISLRIPFVYGTSIVPPFHHGVDLVGGCRSSPVSCTLSLHLYCSESNY